MPINNRDKVTMPIEYAPLTFEDIDAIYPIECGCHAFPCSRKVLAGAFGQRYRSVKMMLDGKIIGFYLAELVIDEMTLQNICIDPAFQGKGYGKQLMNHFMDNAKTEKASQLWLEVRESNTTAIALYNGYGFDVAGTRKNYYPSSNGREDALLMGCFVFLD
jgi:ribosomal-protein-alanine N-acetyltransferase